MTEAAPEQAPLSTDERRVLAERAQALAQPLEEAATAAPTLELLTFSRAGSTYAVAASSVTAVVPLGDATPVPGTPPAVRGVVNHRGRILALVDVGPLISAAESEVMDAGHGIVVATGDASFVLLADGVPELISVEEDELRSAVDGKDGVVRSVIAAMAAVLDVAALAQDPRVAVEDEIE
jgi:purine-binding chemotaxis protein CheW